MTGSSKSPAIGPMPGSNKSPAVSADDVIELLGLVPLEGEGGRLTLMWRDDHSSAIYYLMTPGDFSALHRLSGPELWHHYAGAAVEMLLLAPDGTVSRPVLGDDLARGQRPMVPVPAGVWMAACPTGDWSLTGATLAPPYDPDGFDLGDPDELTDAYPEAAADIARFTRRPA